MKTTVLIVAAGRGTRANLGSGCPKQYVEIAGRPLLAHTLEAFITHPAIDEILVVIHPDDRDAYQRACPPERSKLRAPVSGGATRQDSVRTGLRALAETAPHAVLIHDAARPFVDHDTISGVINALAKSRGAIAAQPLSDTLKRARDEDIIAETIPRKGLWRAQTPQGFLFADILSAHERAAAEGKTGFTDDSALAEWAGMEVKLVAAGGHNMKMTTADDLAMAQRMVGSTFEPRIGSGFDVHKFGPGDHVWLCGLKIEHSQGLVGHSDADAPLHALTDAILGALGDGDIGQHFPPDDPRWKDAPSRLFLEDAGKRVAVRGGRIANVDITILCEAPKIGPHRDAMRRSIAEILHLSIDRIGLKATTTEKLGFTGRGEGLAALASATLLLPATL